MSRDDVKGFDGQIDYVRYAPVSMVSVGRRLGMSSCFSMYALLATHFRFHNDKRGRTWRKPRTGNERGLYQRINHGPLDSDRKPIFVRRPVAQAAGF